LAAVCWVSIRVVTRMFLVLVCPLVAERPAPLELCEPTLSCSHYRQTRRNLERAA
jgi:hypothetical protein